MGPLFLNVKKVLPTYKLISIAGIVIQYLSHVGMECYFYTWAAFSLSKFLTVVNIDHFLHPSPQDPPLKLTINIVSSISTTQASLWSQSMMDSALTW